MRRGGKDSNSVLLSIRISRRQSEHRAPQCIIWKPFTEVYTLGRYLTDE